VQQKEEGEQRRRDGGGMCGLLVVGRDDSDADVEGLEDDSDSEGDKLRKLSHKQLKDRRK
jgi:hypothetical protein